MEKRVSVVIPSYLGAEFLSANLPHVLKLKAAEVIVVNDCSPDETSRLLSEKFPLVKELRHTKNLGFPASVNDGFAQAASPYVLLLNQDVAPSPDIIPLALKNFDSQTVFAVTFNDGVNGWASARLVSGFIQYGNGFSLQPHQSFWASGASSLFNKELWFKLGGLDLIFSPGYHEDQDLGFRAHKAGYSIIWDPKCKVTHISPGSTFSRKIHPRALIHLKERNYLLFHWKNLDPGNLLLHFLFLFLRTIAHPGFIVPILKALMCLPRLKRFPAKVKDSEVLAKFAAYE